MPLTTIQNRITFPYSPYTPEQPMSTEQTDKLKKEGRLEMRVDPVYLKRLDDWRRRQDDLPTRAEALRRLTDIGLQQAS
jgi:hypothetical protein